MQSGISASEELHKAFNELVSDPTQRAVLAGIKNEQLIPTQTISASSSDFSADLSSLASSLKDNEAAYIIIRRYAGASDGYVAVTYVPDIAPVRQKMLFASTRLTLVRELGTERFRETLFATTKAELTAEGFEKHDKHGELKAPLTESEQALQDIKEMEAEAGRTAGSQSLHITGGKSATITPEAVEALKALESGTDNLVQLKIDSTKEIIDLVGSSSAETASLEKYISTEEPRFSFLRYEYELEGEKMAAIVFIYTCPVGAKVRERMLHASFNRSVQEAAKNEAGVIINKKFEESSPDEITQEMLHAEFHPKKETKTAFSRPKRPGR